MKRMWEKLRRLIQRDKMCRDTSYVDKILDDETHHRLASLTLAQYVDLTAAVPLPTTQQRENFVEFVSHAHSRYKHLDINLPGYPFYFFFDKYAGCARVIMQDGTQAFTERTERGFHYSDIPTEQYRTRFGHLAYSCDAGSTVFLTGEGPLVVPRDKPAAVPGDNAQMYRLPEEILEAGLTHLTGMIHTLSATRMLDGDYVRDWPEESGGQVALEKIVTRWRIIREPTFQREEMEVDDGLRETNPSLWMALLDADPVLYELLAPDRRRQYGEMKKAIDRVCEVIDSQRRQPTHQE